MSQWLSSLCMLTDSGKEALSYIVNQGSAVSFVKAIAFDPQNSIADADLPKKSTENTLAGYLDITSATGGATPNVVPKVLSPQRALPMTLKARRTLEDSAPYGTAVDLTVGNINFQLNKPTTHPAYTIPVNGFSVKYIGIYLVATGFNESKPFLFQIMKSTLGTDDGYDVISASSLVTFSYSVYLYHTDTLESNQFNISIAEIDTVNGEMLDEAMNELREEVEAEVQGLGGINKTYIASQYSFSTEQAVNYIDLTIQNGASELPDLDVLKQPMLIIPDFTTESDLTFNISNGYAFSESLIRVTNIEGSSNSYPIIIATEVTDPAMTLNFYKETIMLIFKEINNVAGYELISLSNSSGNYPLYTDFNDVPKKTGTYFCSHNANNAPLEVIDNVWVAQVYVDYTDNFVMMVVFDPANSGKYFLATTLDSEWTEYNGWATIKDTPKGIYKAKAFFANENGDMSTSSDNGTINGTRVAFSTLWIYIYDRLDDLSLQVGDIVFCELKGSSSSVGITSIKGFYINSYEEVIKTTNTSYSELRTKECYNDTGASYTCKIPANRLSKMLILRYNGGGIWSLLNKPAPEVTVSTSAPSSNNIGVYGDLWCVVGS